MLLEIVCCVVLYVETVLQKQSLIKCVIESIGYSLGSCNTELERKMALRRIGGRNSLLCTMLRALQSLAKANYVNHPIMLEVTARVSIRCLYGVTVCIDHLE